MFLDDPLGIKRRDFNEFGNFRVGYVQEVNTNGWARVVFKDVGEKLSYWLPIIVPKIMKDKFMWYPDNGEQVLCLMDEHDENGAVLGAIPSLTDVPPSASSVDQSMVQFEDGTSFSYNRSTHVMDVSLATGAACSIFNPNGQKIELDGSGNVTCVGKTVSATDSAGSEVQLDGAGNANLTGSTVVNITAGTINLTGPVILGSSSGGTMTSTGPISIGVPSGDKLEAGGGTALLLATLLTWLFAHTHNGVNGVTSAPNNPPTAASVSTQTLMGA